MRRFKIKLFQFAPMLMTVVLFSCGGGGGNGEEPPEEKAEPPAKVVGTLPANGEPCSDYEEVPGNDSKVLIPFKWNAAQLAQSYTLAVIQGSTQVFENSLSTLEAKVELDRGRTYSWSVTSANADGETNGDTYSFTTPGIPESNFAPYAATISIEFNIENSVMSISWIGSDEDGDELVYDITVWEGDTIMVEENDLAAVTIDPIAYANGEKYTVEVVSKDPSGSSSISVKENEAPE